jgi:oxalate---CoA ligase
MRSIQPRGPYFIGGYSFGGVIALEMAQQLQATGEETALVVLFDTFCTPTLMGDHRAGEGTSFLLGKLKRGVKQASSPLMSPRLISKGIRRRWENLTVPRRLKMVRRTCEYAGRNYVPRSYQGKVVLYRSSNPPVMQADPYEGWNACIGNLEICEVEGDHDGIMLEPQVRLVAQHLSHCLIDLHSGLKPTEVLSS